jgi:hypothetical protein
MLDGSFLYYRSLFFPIRSSRCSLHDLALVSKAAGFRPDLAIRPKKCQLWPKLNSSSIPSAYRRRQIGLAVA